MMEVYSPFVVPSRRYRLRSGEIMQLLGATAYAKINAAAYPKNGDPVDENALFFIESAKFPYSEDGLIVVNEPPVTTAMKYFKAKGWVTQVDVDRVTGGI